MLGFDCMLKAVATQLAGSRAFRTVADTVGNLACHTRYDLGSLDTLGIGL